MSDTIWSYHDNEWSHDQDLVGYEVEADGGSIGKVDAASTDASAQWLVVDTGPRRLLQDARQYRPDDC